MSTTPTSQRKTRKLRLELYRDADRKWRWRSISRNGRGTATPGEGYTRRIDALANAGLVIGFYVGDVQWITADYAQVSPTTRTDVDYLEVKVVQS